MTFRCKLRVEQLFLNSGSDMAFRITPLSIRGGIRGAEEFLKPRLRVRGIQ